MIKIRTTIVILGLLALWFFLFKMESEKTVISPEMETKTKLESELENEMILQKVENDELLEYLNLKNDNSNINQN